MSRHVDDRRSLTPADADELGGASTRRGVTRRQALQAGAVTVGTLAVDAAAAHAGTDLGTVRQGRTEVSFDDDWLFFLGDPDGASAPSFDDSSWRQLDLPHDWSIEDLSYATSTDGAATADPSLFDWTTSDPAVPGPTFPGVPSVIGPFDQVNSAGQGATGYTVGGIGWYRKHFVLPGWQQEQHHVELLFEGIYEDADIYLNGVHLGFHPNGYVSFFYDLTPYLNVSGDNVLAVRVNQTGLNSRWYAGAGIYRHTWLTTTGPVRIPTWGVVVTTPTVGGQQQQSVVNVEVQTTNLGTAGTEPQVEVTLLAPDGQRVARSLSAAQSLSAGATATFQLTLSVARTALWSPSSPSLYQAVAEVVIDGRSVDSVSTTFGIRSLEWNGTDGFLLNGAPMKVHGACLHASHGPMGAVSLARTEEREIETLKAVGFNAIRTAHNPPSPAALDACDRLGMLVWDEFSDMWNAAKNPDDYSQYFAQYWQQDLTGMVLRDRNHASVVIWSLGNEINDTTNGVQGAAMAALVHSLDATRPVSQGARPFVAVTDPMYQYVDVVDVHYDLPSPDKMALHAAYPDKAMTQSESWSTAVYADLMLAEQNAWFVGSWVWVGWDYMGESASGAPIYAASDTNLPVFGSGTYPWFQDCQGDVDLIGQRKPQNYYRAVVYGYSQLEMMVQRPAPTGTTDFAVDWAYYDELPSWTWDLPEGQPMTVHVYTNGDTVTLLLNGTTVATNSVTASDQCVTTFTVPYTPGELTAIATLNGSQIGRKTYATTGSPAALQLLPDVAWLTTSRDDLAHVVVEVVDSDGQRVPDAVVGVSFQLDGAGELVAVGNGNPHNVDSFQRSGRYTWHGQALAILRPATTPGMVTLTATAPGLQPATVSLRVGRALNDATVAQQSVRRSGLRRRRPSALTASLAGSSAAPLLVLGAAGALLRRRLGAYRWAPDEGGDTPPTSPR